MGEVPVHVLVASAGFALGAVFGVTVHRSNFCMMGAVADLTIAGNATRMRAWLLAIAVAVLATQGLQLLGVVDLGSAFYLSARLLWAGNLLGGLLFGFGMVIACGCPSRSLVNLGTGDLRALVSLTFLAITATMTLHGLTGLARLGLERATALDLAASGLPSQGLVELGAARLGIDPGPLRAAAALLVAGTLLWVALRDAALRRERGYLAGACLVGLSVGAGWVITGVLGADEFEPAALGSLTFVRPVGDALQYLMTFTGSQANFGIGLVGGVLAGAFGSALASGRLHLQAFEDVRDLARYMVGGALMGLGGVSALGCTVGQGITGVSTLALGSLLALVAIIAGGVLGARYLEQGSLAGALRATLGR